MNPRNFNKNSIADRATDELVGLCRGILADGHVSRSEAEFLLDWLKRNTDNLDRFPFNVLHGEIEGLLADEVLSEAQQLKIIDLLIMVLGTPLLSEPSDMTEKAPTSAPAMPYTKDKIDSVEGIVITLTGEFEFGPRSEIVEILESQGAIFAPRITRKTDILVIGDIGSDQWKHSSFGRKIEKALEMKGKGNDIDVMGEKHLTPHLYSNMS